MTDMDQSAAIMETKARHREVMAKLDAEREARLLAGMPIAARMYFDPVLFERMNAMAERMAASPSMPKHIRGDSIMGLYCIERGWSWGMSPLAVAMGTFKIGEQIGHYGRIIIAAINGSGRLRGALRFEHFAEAEAQGHTWAKVTANFREMASATKKDEHGNPVKYLVPAYTRADEEGLGVEVIGHLDGEDQPRRLRFYLRQAWPRNSTLWATDPATQICYVAGRRFGSLYMPEVVAGVRMEDEIERPMIDVTPTQAPQPQARQYDVRYAMAHDIQGRMYTLLPGEIEQWVNRQLEHVSSDEIDQLIEANRGSFQVVDAIRRVAIARYGAPLEASRGEETPTPPPLAPDGQSASAPADEAPKRRGRPKLAKTVAREMIDEIGATAPADVMVYMQAHAEALDGFEADLQREVWDAAHARMEAAPAADDGPPAAEPSSEQAPTYPMRDAKFNFLGSFTASEYLERYERLEAEAAGALELARVRNYNGLALANIAAAGFETEVARLKGEEVHEQIR